MPPPHEAVNLLEMGKLTSTQVPSESDLRERESIPPEWLEQSEAAARRPLTIRIDDLSGSEITALLNEHLQNLAAISPPASMHALSIEALRRPEITFWSVWEAGELAGCGALKEIDALHAELKSMRTALAHRRKGVAAKLLQHIMVEAKRRGYLRLSLETGAIGAFEPARKLYAKFGFKLCAPFAGYTDDPNSVFMTTEL